MKLKLPEIGDSFEKRYELLELLGSGGAGTVFKARQIETGRLIALKVLHPHRLIDDDVKQRFLREAQALSKLCHVNIVTVYHLQLSKGALPYLAMELIDGVSLRKQLAAGKMPVHRVLKIAEQLCSALCCMHEFEIIHRDLKPENIMLLPKPEPDTVKIIDFGLVKVDANSEQKLTETGLLIGSVNYMSPEQCEGKKADVRSDIYALAVCMYEMLSGEPPFTAENSIGVMYKHINLQAPELRFKTGELVHPAIQKFIGKGLEKDPALRFQTAAEMSEALSKLGEHLAGDVPTNAASAKPLGGRPLVWLSTVILCAIVCTFIWNQIHQSQLHSSDTEQKKYRFENLLKHELKTSVLTHSADHSEETKRLVDEAKVYVIHGKSEEAERLLKRALAMNEKALRPNQAEMSAIYFHLATCYEQQNKFADAESLLKQALTNREKVLGPDNTDVAAIVLQLANCYAWQGKYASAEQLYKRSIKIMEKAVGPNDSSVGIALSKLGECYNKQGKYEMSEPLLKRAMAIDEEVLGPDSLQEYGALYSLAQCSEHKGNFAEAELLFRRSLTIAEKTAGPDSPLVASTLRDLARCVEHQGKHAEALRLMQRASAIKLNTTDPVNKN